MLQMLEIQLGHDNPGQDGKSQRDLSPFFFFPVSPHISMTPVFPPLFYATFIDLISPLQYDYTYWLYNMSI